MNPRKNSNKTNAVFLILGELIGIASPSKDGLMSKNGFLARGKADINTDANKLITTGIYIYAVYCYGQDYASKHYPMELGHIIVFVDNVGGSKSQLAISSTGGKCMQECLGENITGVNGERLRYKRRLFMPPFLNRTMIDMQHRRM